MLTPDVTRLRRISIYEVRDRMVDLVAHTPECAKNAFDILATLIGQPDAPPADPAMTGEAPGADAFDAAFKAWLGQEGAANRRDFAAGWKAALARPAAPSDAQIGEPPPAAERKGKVEVDTPKMLDCGHGHVYPRSDGVLSRCGGAGICRLCARDAAYRDGFMAARRVAPVTEAEVDAGARALYAMRNTEFAALWERIGDAQEDYRTEARAVLLTARGPA
jgi:hypothetical protein